MRRTIRLTKRADIDLIVLYRNGVPLGRILTEALIAYERKEKISVHLPKIRNYSLDALFPFKNVPLRDGDIQKRVSHIDIGFYIPDKCSSAFKGPRSAYGSTFAKLLIRNSIYNLPVLPLFPDTDSEVYAAAKNRALKKHSEPCTEDILAEVQKARAYDDCFAESIPETITHIVKDGKLILNPRKYPVEDIAGET